MLGNRRFPIWVKLLATCRGELSQVIARLISKYLWSVCKWYRGVKKVAYPLPCCPVNRECSWKKTHRKKISTKIFLSVILFVYHLWWLCCDNFIISYMFDIPFSLNRGRRNCPFSKWGKKKEVKRCYRPWGYPESFGIYFQLDKNCQTCFFILLNLHVSWIRPEFCRPEWAKGGTPWE